MIYTKRAKQSITYLRAINAMARRAAWGKISSASMLLADLQYGRGVMRHNGIKY